MSVLSLDFETFYNSQISVKGMGPVAYCRALDPIRDIYWIALENDEGWKWAGHPGDMDDTILGRIRDADVILSHNAAFDSCVWDFMARAYGLGQEFFEPLYAKWECTSDLASCLGVPRSLAGACHQLLGVLVNKDMRTAMKDRRFEELTDEKEKEEFIRYAFTDTHLCLQLWEKYGSAWSPMERWLSKHTRVLQRRGIGIDRELCAKQLEAARELLEVTSAQIPWNGRRKIGSRNAFFDACEAAGVPKPTTTNKKSPHWIEWVETYGDFLPWAKAVSQYRTINRLIPILESFYEQSDNPKDPRRLSIGTFPVQLMYYGGHTGRWAGTGGLNLQNLNRSVIADIDLRGCLCARPGKTLTIADFSAIEAVISLWLIGEESVLSLVRGGQSIYEAFARSRGLWKNPGVLKKEDPALYQSVKAQVLGLQFGMGAAKYRSVFLSQTGIDLGVEGAALAVGTFRNSLPGLLKAWRTMEAELIRQKGRDGVIEKPGGGVIHYRNIRMAREERGFQIYANTLHQGQLREVAWWGGSLWENYVQSIARDMLCELIVDLEDNGLPVVLHVHDEVVVEVDKEDALMASEFLTNWKGVEWSKGCPVKLEVAEPEGVERYQK